MTIKELKELIKEIPDYVDVIIEISDDGIAIAVSAENTGMGEDGVFYIGTE